MAEKVAREAAAAFAEDAARAPLTSLRAGNSIDDYERPPPYDPARDLPTDDYLERYAFYGIAHLDAHSWRHYLPRLIDYASRNHTARDLPHGGLVMEGLLGSLRPPDRDPPRLASLTTEQERAIVALLDALAFGDGSTWQQEAMDLLEDYWAPEAVDQRAHAATTP